MIYRIGVLVGSCGGDIEYQPGLIKMTDGFGFAGNLSTIGLMEGRLLPAVAGFNIGVELGQILIVLVVYLIFSQMTKFIRESINTARVCAASEKYFRNLSYKIL